jgi:hypothetical protein
MVQHKILDLGHWKADSLPIQKKNLSICPIHESFF